MEDGPRRSGRARKQIKKLADEQAEAADVAAAAQPARKKQRHSKTNIKNEANDEELGNYVQNETVIEGSDDLPLSELDYADDESVEEPPPKKRKKTAAEREATKALKNGAQLYGAPPIGTLLPWYEGRMRKQPKVWEVKQKGPAKSADFHAAASESRGQARIAAIKDLAADQEETLLQSDVDEEDDRYAKAREKAMTEKLVVLERTRDTEAHCHAHHGDCPTETLQIVGSKGNVYTVRISHIMTCTCPVGVFTKKGNEGLCKHIIYALHTVLRVPDHLQYRQSFLYTELKELFDNSPALPSQVADESEKDGNRKAVEGECGICAMDFEEGEALVWCKAACGNNLHAACFKQWEKTKAQVTCPFCRAHWQDDAQGKATMAEVTMPTDTGRGGYYNVGDQLGY